MTALFGIFSFIFGTIVGSFLNVLILRHGTGQSVKGRSHCFSCGKTLVWYELLPLASFFALKGKCRSCKSSISLQYPIVELVTGLIFLGLFLKFREPSSLYQVLNVAYYAIVFCLLVIISVYDLRHKIIPNAFVYPFILLSLLVPIAKFGEAIFQFPALLELLAGPILAAPFAILWVVSSGRWMGLGDAKLALGIGLLLGFSSGILSVILAFWIGAVVSILMIFFLRPWMPKLVHGFTIKSEIPFGPFLVLGALIVFFFDFNLLGLPF